MTGRTTDVRVAAPPHGYPRPGWTLQANCRLLEIPTQEFIVDNSGRMGLNRRRRIQAICTECPVRLDCAAGSKRSDEFIYRGGFSPSALRAAYSRRCPSCELQRPLWCWPPAMNRPWNGNPCDVCRNAGKELPDE